MTVHTPRFRPTMCQVMRPGAHVVGPLEMHGYVGLSVAPPGLMKSEFALWWSAGTAWDTNEKSSKTSETVFAANDRLMQHGSEAKGRTHYLLYTAGVSLTPPPKPAVAFGPLPYSRKGFLEDDSGESATIFAPRHVRASIDGEREVAVIMFFRGSYGGVGNLSVCSDPLHLPLTLMTQTPSSVFLGMTEGDAVASMTMWLVRSVANGILSYAIKKASGHLMDRVIDQMARQLTRYVSEGVRDVLSRVLRPAVSELARTHGPGVARGAAKNATKWGIRQAVGHSPAVNGADTSTAADDIADLWDDYVESP